MILRHIFLILWALLDLCWLKAVPESVLALLGPYGNNKELNLQHNFNNSIKAMQRPKSSKRPETKPGVAVNDLPRSFRKDYKDRNDHSKDFDKISDRSSKAAFIMSFVIIVLSAVSLIALYIAHIYYRRKIERELYRQEQRKIVAEIRKPTRYTSFMSGLSMPGVTTAEEALKAPTPPPDVEKWNSLLHLFWRFRI